MNDRCGSCCYVLSFEDGRASYCGVTDNLTRRLEQHNGRKAGGARYTARHRRGIGGEWRPLWVVRGFASRAQALSFEWRVKRVRVPTPCGLVRRRTSQILAVLLRDGGRWWRRNPPCPRAMQLEWWGGGGASTCPVTAADFIGVRVPFEGGITVRTMPDGVSLLRAPEVVSQAEGVPDDGGEVREEQPPHDGRAPPPCRVRCLPLSGTAPGADFHGRERLHAAPAHQDGLPDGVDG